MPNYHPTAVLLASGGMDSTTMAYWLKSQQIEFIPLFINYGQHCTDTELETLRYVIPQEDCEHITILQVADIYRGSRSRLIDEANLWTDRVDHKDFYLPYRNLLLLTVGAAFAQTQECTELYAAFINSNHAQEIDCSAAFFDQLGQLLSDYGAVQIRMPFRNMSKYDVAKLGISLAAPIGATFSCQASATVPCGACPNCVDRLEALRQLNEEN
jgi:7-cyano-7-deazaguanine synthase